ncbi:MAG: hypothetical protein ACOYXB_13495 [Bacteroidota bacterium]
MFRSFPHFKIPVVIVFAVLLTGNLYAQQTEQNLSKLKEETAARFSAGDYPEALSGFRILMERYPRDPLYQYYAGTCLVKLNLELPEAITLLRFAVNSDVPADAWYQLALACQREYRFNDAEEAIRGFRDNASRQELKAVDTDLFLASVGKARELTKTYNPYEVLNVTFIRLSDSTDYSQIRMRGGNLTRKPESLFAANEPKDDLNSLMFIPPKIEKNDDVYYAGLSKSGKGGYQLFRVRKGVKAAWSAPEELQELNTAGDEILPYYDPIGKDIYFASDGRPGLGGFDLYKSHYDAENDSWSAPVNMGFPVNSSADEYLLLPGSDLGMEMFFSTRQGTDSTTTVYRVHFSEPRQPVGSDDPGRIMEIATLGGVAARSLEQLELELAANKEPETRYMGETENIVENEVSEKPEEYQRIVPAIHPTASTAYQQTLTRALTLQSEADSLSGLAIAARVKVRDSDDPNDRWLYQKQILVWEKRAADAQAVADSCYAVLPTLDRSEPAKELPASIEKDKEVGDLTTYRYRQEESGQKEPVGVNGEPGEVVKEVVIESKESEPAVPEVINRFEILSASPYSAGDPIPLNVPLPSGSFYRIQLGAYSKAVAPDAFGGLSPVTGEEFPERGLIKYYTGKFSRYADADKALNLVRTSGYPDAYIVAWYNGTQISVARAKELEL